MCLSVRDHISGTTDPIFTKLFVHVTDSRGSVLLWRCSDIISTSCFMDDAAAQPKRSADAGSSAYSNSTGDCVCVEDFTTAPLFVVEHSDRKY